jgi:hypothetical protein
MKRPPTGAASHATIALVLICRSRGFLPGTWQFPRPEWQDWSESSSCHHWSLPALPSSTIPAERDDTRGADHHRSPLRASRQKGRMTWAVDRKAGMTWMNQTRSHGVVHDAFQHVGGLAADLLGKLRPRRASTRAHHVEFVHAQFALVRVIVHVRLLFKEDDLFDRCHRNA